VGDEELRLVEDAVRRQDEWRARCINLIASENVLSRRARQLLPSDFNHRYAEGHPGARYYQGTANIDEIEARAVALMKELFGVPKAEVRTISGTNANDVAFAGLLQQQDPVMVNPLPAGGHISHQQFGGMGKYTRAIHQWPRAADGYSIDVAKSKDLLREVKPKLAIFGKSLILFREPVKELAPVAREVGATVMYDGAHVLGLICGGAFQNPFEEGAQLLTGSTHKTFFGPQRGVLLGTLDDERWKRIDKLAFPGTLSNHHLMTLPPLVAAALEMKAFGREYAKQVVANAKRLAASLSRLGVEVACPERGFTETHQVAVDVSKHGGGGKAAEALEKNDIIVNRNQLPHDPPKKLSNPSGLRLGAQEMTRMGMKESEMDEIARLIHAVVVGARDVKAEVNAFRSKFQAVGYSFDAPRTDAKASAVEMDIAGY
jgi:glycine hydroxymethyltransferase